MQHHQKMCIRDSLFSDYTFNHNVEVEKDILKDECEEMLKKFFKLK